MKDRVARAHVEALASHRQLVVSYASVSELTAKRLFWQGAISNVRRKHPNRRFHTHALGGKLMITRDT